LPNAPPDKPRAQPRHFNHFFARKGVMTVVDNKVFKYPSEDECLVRRLGVGLMSVWPSLPPETREKILSHAGTAWDREYHVAQLPLKLEALLKRFNLRAPR
jgi:hypothetical protein